MELRIRDPSWKYICVTSKMSTTEIISISELLGREIATRKITEQGAEGERLKICTCVAVSLISRRYVKLF